MWITSIHKVIPKFKNNSCRKLFSNGLGGFSMKLKGTWSLFLFINNLKSSSNREFPKCLSGIIYYSPHLHAIVISLVKPSFKIYKLNSNPYHTESDKLSVSQYLWSFWGVTSIIDLNTSLLLTHSLILGEFFFLCFASHFLLMTPLLDCDPLSSFPEVPHKAEEIAEFC